MKKYLYIAIAAATLASCSQDEVMDVAEKEAISFGNVYVGKSTRAADPSYSSKTIQSFRLFGTMKDISIYNDVLVENKTAAGANDDAGYGSVWYCPVTQYWVSDVNYKFAAVVDAKKINLNAQNMPTSLEYDLDGTSDMLYDDETRINETTTVGFNFTHLLSKVYFTFTNGMTEGKYSYKVTSVKIKSGLAKSGVYTIGATTPWTMGTDKSGSLIFGNVVAVDADGKVIKDSEGSPTLANLTYGVGATSADARLIIPGEQTLVVEYTLETLYDGSTLTTVTKTANVPTTTFAENCVYNIQATLSLNNKIQFTVTKAPEWTSTEIPLTAQ